jgi:hypothetical protein
MASINSRAAGRSPAHRAYTPAAAPRPWSGRKSGSGSYFVNPLCLLFHAGLIPAMPGSAMQDFRIFHTMPGTWIAPAAMTGNTIVVAWSFLSQDSWPSLMSYRQQKRKKWLPPIQKKTGKPDLGLTYNDVVFRPNRGYDSEVQGRQISFDKNQELTRADA